MDPSPLTERDALDKTTGTLFIADVSFAQPAVAGVVSPDVPEERPLFTNVRPVVPSSTRRCEGRVRRGRAPRLRSNNRRRGSKRAAGIRSGQDPGDPDLDPDGLRPLLLGRVGR
jgi:hypothetical protein